MHYILLCASYLNKPQLQSVQKLGKKHSVRGRLLISNLWSVFIFQFTLDFGITSLDLKTAVLYEWIFWLNELIVTDQLNLILDIPVLVYVVNIWFFFSCISQKGRSISLFSDSSRTKIYSVCSCDLETVYFLLLWPSSLVDVTYLYLILAGILSGKICYYNN